MKSKARSFRKLRPESLESRQLLHGGALGCEPLPATDIAEFNTNDDTVLTADNGVAGRVLERLANADTDGHGGRERMGSFRDRVVGNIVQIARGRIESGGMQGKSFSERLDAFYANKDADGDGLLTSEEVSERLWARLASADINEDGVSREELDIRLEARHAGRLDAAFERLDKNDDGSVTADEVSDRRWERISEAAGNDDAVTQDELSEHVEVKRAERQAGNDGTRAEARAARQEAREARQEARAERQASNGGTRAEPRAALEAIGAERQAGNGDTRAEARASRQEAREARREARQEAREARREARQEARAEAAQAETP